MTVLSVFGLKSRKLYEFLGVLNLEMNKVEQVSAFGYLSIPKHKDEILYIKDSFVLLPTEKIFVLALIDYVWLKVLTTTGKICYIRIAEANKARFKEL